MTDAILTRREGSALIAQINNAARRNAIAKEHCEALSAALADASSANTSPQMDKCKLYFARSNINAQTSLKPLVKRIFHPIRSFNFR